MADKEEEKKRAELYGHLVGKLKDQDYDEALEAADELLELTVGVMRQLGLALLCPPSPHPSHCSPSVAGVGIDRGSGPRLPGVLRLPA
jgi:hypothetical protein